MAMPPPLRVRRRRRRLLRLPRPLHRLIARPFEIFPIVFAKRPGEFFPYQTTQIDLCLDHRGNGIHLDNHNTVCLHKHLRNRMRGPKNSNTCLRVARRNNANEKTHRIDDR